MTCSQLSYTIRHRLSRRKPTADETVLRSQDEAQRRFEGADDERRVFR
jgi:hypothetical protein